MASSLSPDCVDSSSLLPVFDLTSVVHKEPGCLTNEDLEMARQLAECVQRTGCLLVRDPRVTVADNNQFLDLMESYFSQPPDMKQAESRPDLHFQVGVTPCGTEVPRCLVDEQLQAEMQALGDGSRATTPMGPDLKWRYMWRVGPRPKDTRFPELNAAPVIPKAFPEWQPVMDGWGARMLEAARCVAGLMALGFGLPPSSIVDAMAQGPHLLAPTGSDLAAHSDLGTVFAGYHYDLNLLTIHGKSRFPGLHVWLRDGRRVAVRVPDGCLLLQAGKQLEWLTGGHVRAGMHEVVVTPETQAAVEAARAAGRSLWRVSSTVFAHVASDATLQPLGHFAQEPGAMERYPPVLAGEQVQRELEAICLRKAGRGGPAGLAAAGGAAGAVRVAAG